MTCKRQVDFCQDSLLTRCVMQEKTQEIIIRHSTSGLNVLSACFFALCSLGTGCQPSPNCQYPTFTLPSAAVVDAFWTPTAEQIVEARRLAVGYIEKNLHIRRDVQTTMEVKASGLVDAGHRRLMELQYFDSERIPDWERTVGVMGGYPAYFRVTVDMTVNRVVAHYASRR